MPRRFVTYLLIFFLVFPTNVWAVLIFDEQGVEQTRKVDGGNLRVEAKHIVGIDLKDFEKSDQKGGSLGVSTGDVKDTNAGLDKGTTTIGLTHSGHEKEGITKATIGKGEIVIGDGTDVASLNLNRDIDNRQEITKDVVTGALDVDLKIDNRIFSDDGRTEIAKQHDEYGKNIVQIGDGLRNNVVTKSIENALTDEKKGLFDAVSDYLSDDQKIKDILADKQRTAEMNGLTNLDAEGVQNTLQDVADIAGGGDGFTGNLDLYNTGTEKGYAYDDGAGNKTIGVNVGEVDIADSGAVINNVFHETTNKDQHSASEQTAVNRGDTAEGIWNLKNFGNENTNQISGKEWNNKHTQSLTIESGNQNKVYNYSNYVVQKAMYGEKAESTLNENKPGGGGGLAAAIVGLTVYNGYLAVKSEDGNIIDAHSQLKDDPDVRFWRNVVGNAMNDVINGTLTAGDYIVGAPAELYAYMNGKGETGALNEYLQHPLKYTTEGLGESTDNLSKFLKQGLKEAHPSEDAGKRIDYAFDMMGLTAEMVAAGTLVEGAAGIKGAAAKKSSTGGGAQQTTPKSPKSFIEPTNPPQTPKIPDGYITEKTKNGNGTVHRQAGTTGNANTIRIMNSTKDYPNGYSVQYNSSGQPINPATGKPGAASETHIPLPPK